MRSPAPGHRAGDRLGDWRAACLTGLATSSFSSAVANLGAGRIGRDPGLTWMEVGLVVLRGGGVRAKPGRREVVAGLLVHQAADFGWAVLFFGVGRLWTRRLTPPGLAVLAPVWAAATAAAEYWLILPWLQPLLKMQTPYWVAAMVHLASSAVYPLAPGIRAAGEGREVPGSFERRWALGLAGLLAGLGAVEAVSRTRGEPVWPFASPRSTAAVKSFLRRMAAHHAVGVALAAGAAERAERAEARLLGRLMAAEQRAEIVTMDRWQQSWFGGPLPPPTEAEHAAMPGMPDDAVMAELAGRTGRDFEALFLPVMIRHHEGALRMAAEARREAADPRVRLFAAQMAHAQRGQRDRMAALAGEGTA